MTGGYLCAQTDPAAITDGFTPAAIAPGTPQGVTFLSPHDAVNYYNGNLAFSIPLNSVNGRGGAGYTITLPIGTKWVIENHPSPQDVFVAVPSVFPYEGLWMDGAAPRYMPGRMLWREVVDETKGVTGTCAGGTNGATYSFYLGQTLTRLTWVEADGTEHEFQDTQSSGSPLPAAPNYTCASDHLLSRPSRGTVFISDDATAATFIADSTVYDWITTLDRQTHVNKGVQGWLLFKDGRRYQTDSTGNVIQMIDRLGNTTTISGGVITDSLGRSITISEKYSNGAPTMDQIIYPAADGNTHTITVNYDSLQNHLRTGFSVQTTSSLFQTTNGSPVSEQFNPVVVSSVVLPDGSSYTIQYNSYGEVAQVTLPTGGFYQYDYPVSTPSCDGTNYTGCAQSGSNGATDMQTVLRRVTARRVYANGGTLEGQTCYSPTFAPDGSTTTTQVTFYDGTASPGSCGSGNVISSETHTFRSTPVADLGWVDPPSFWYPEGFAGRETQTTWNTAGGTALKTVSNTWSWNSTGVFSGQLPTNEQTWFNLTPCQTLTTLSGTSPVTSGRFFLYDKYFNVTDTYEYDFGAAPAPASSCSQTVPAGYGRQAHVSYVADGNYDVVSTPASGPNSNHMRNLVQESDTYDGAGTLAARTQYAYDESAPTLENTLVGYVAPTHSKLGNLTSKSAWLNTTGSYWKSTYTYDNLGNVLTIKDPRQMVTTLFYGDNCLAVANPPAGVLSIGSLYAFPTRIINAIGQPVQVQYDCYIGKQKQFTDANSTVTSYSYSGDPFDRLLSVQRAVSTPAEAHTTFSYPNLTTVTTKQDQASIGDGAIVTTSLFDGLGRLSQTQHSAPGGGYIATSQSYDGKGQPWRSSLPYNPQNGETAHYVTTSYDGAGRVVSVATDDGAATATSYSGSQTTTSDPAGATRTITSDGFGRVNSAVEDPTGKNYLTSYTYDVLDDLKTVTQGAQTRSFTYNSLKQLVSATNPESGAICYGPTASPCTENYDGNGNLLYRTDSRGVTTSYTYDALSRVTAKSYSDGATPGVFYAYDTATLGIGRLASVSTAALGSIPAFSTLVTSYDALGHPTASTQTIGSANSYTFSYTYNLAGGLTKETYPSLRAVSTTYDVLNRPSGLSGQMGADSSTYLNSVSYSSGGAVSQLQFGAAPLVTESVTFDQGLSTLRGQPTQLAVSLASGTNLVTLGYGYCPGDPAPAQCASNNGNVQSASITAPGPAVNVWQTFGYDKLNRLISALETPVSGSSTTAWSQVYVYDAFGNRWLDPSSSGLSLSPFTPQYSTNFNSNNQLVIQSSTYDTAGNQKTIGGFSYSYDAENRVSLVTEPSGATPSSYQYFYDGDGRRVQKVASGGSTTSYVYDVAGNLAAEYVSGTAPTLACTTCYLVQDTLGSTRMMLDASTGAPVALHDYLPFGEEIVNARPGSLYSGTDDPRQKFTGKERDSETGLDFFGARYLSGAQGRFSSADAPFNDQDPSDPQSWNLYSYVRNNPLNSVDPTGTVDCKPSQGGDFCVERDEPSPTPAPPPDTGLSSFGQFMIGSLLNTVHTTTQVAEKTQQVVQSAVDWLGSQDPSCTLKGMAAGGGAGLALGSTVGLAGGPTAFITVPVGGGLGLLGGAGFGGIAGMSACSSGSGGSGKGGDYRPKTAGANANDAKTIRDVAREEGVDARKFGKFVEAEKRAEGRRASENYSYDELKALAGC